MLDRRSRRSTKIRQFLITTPQIIVQEDDPLPQMVCQFCAGISPSYFIEKQFHSSGSCGSDKIKYPTCLWSHPHQKRPFLSCDTDWPLVVRASKSCPEATGQSVIGHRNMPGIRHQNSKHLSSMRDDDDDDDDQDIKSQRATDTEGSEKWNNLENTTSNWFFLERNKEKKKTINERTNQHRPAVSWKGYDGRWTFLLQFPSSGEKIPMAKPIPAFLVIPEKLLQELGWNGGWTREPACTSSSWSLYLAAERDCAQWRTVIKIAFEFIDAILKY